MSIPRFPEKTAAWIPFTCYDKDDALVVPTTLEYRIDCKTSEAEIRDDTSLTPASSGEIELVPADTTLQSQDNGFELRVITVTADSGLATQHIEQYKFEAANLSAVT